MESKFYKKPVVNEPVFFPHYFKTIGMVMVLLAIAVMAVLKWIRPELIAENKDAFKTYSKSVLLIGLFCFAWSKEKHEDEMTFSIRLKAISLAVYFVIGMILLEPYLKFLFGPGNMGSGHQVVFMLLFFYLVFYYGSKWAAKR